MKTIEEQTKESAVKHYEDRNKYPSNGVKEDCMDDFTAGAEWERQRAANEQVRLIKGNPMHFACLTILNLGLSTEQMKELSDWCKSYSEPPKQRP